MNEKKVLALNHLCEIGRCEQWLSHKIEFITFKWDAQIVATTVYLWVERSQRSSKSHNECHRTHRMPNEFMLNIFRQV